MSDLSVQRIQRPEAKVIAEEEFRRFAALTASLTADEWALPTDCTAWDVRKVVAARARLGRRAGVVPAVRASARARRAAEPADRLAPLGRRHERAADPRASPTSPTTRSWRSLQAVGPKAVAGRWRTPAPMRHLPIPFGPPIGWVGLWYLLDVGLHARRVGPPHRPRAPRPGTGWTSPPTTTAVSSPTSSASGRTIHGQPFELVLEGPAGGKFSQGTGGERVEIDAIEFVQVLSGRRPGTGVLANPLPL